MAAGAGGKTSDGQISKPSLRSLATNFSLVACVSLVQKRNCRSDSLSLSIGQEGTVRDGNMLIMTTASDRF